MGRTKIEIDADSIDIRDYVNAVGPDEILSNLTIGDVVSYWGEGRLLDQIGEQEAKDHFGLVTKRELFEDQLDELIKKS